MSKKKIYLFKRFLAISAVLIAVETGVVFYFKSQRTTQPMKEIISDLSKKSDLSFVRREQLKVQVSVRDYMSKNGGTMPKKLEDLVPAYFDSVPVNPETGKPFIYKIEGSRFYVFADDREAAGPGVAGNISQAALGAKAAHDQKQTLINSLSDVPNSDGYIYTPADKRDPYRPFATGVILDSAGKTPLELFELGQLKLTAVLEGFDKPKALVENLAGKGFTVTIGTKIGPNNGEIVEIAKDRIVIIEQTTDLTGKKTTNTQTMKLRVGSAKGVD